MDLKLILKILGRFCLVFGLLLLIPGVFSVFDRDQFSWTFMVSALVSFVVGAVFWLSQREYQAELNNRSAFALVTLTWTSACILGALPYYLSGTLPTYVDSFFEATSGFSGTGASVIQNVEGVDRALLLWRSITQWVGGMGIIVFFVAVLPILGFGGVQLFRAEMAGPQKDRITPRVTETARKLWILYLSFTAILAILLSMAGMPLFDSVNHAFTTLATGGFSTKNSGIAYFNNATIDYLIIAFMVLASVSFTLHYRLLVQHDCRVFKDTEFKWYIATILGSTLLITLLLSNRSESSFWQALRPALFTVAATVSSTGFSYQDYTLWSPACQLILVLLMVMGGMSGSTAGGLKCIRLVAALKQLLKQLIQTVHPNAVLTIRANGHAIPDQVVDSIWGLIFLYFLVFSIATTILTSQDIDLVSACSAVFSALSNVGPALGTLGPSANYFGLPDVSKVTLSICMIVGRLEFLTVLVLFTPDYWRK